MEVMLVVYDKDAYEVSGKLFSDIKSYIDEKDVVLPNRRRRERRYEMNRRAMEDEEIHVLEDAAEIYDGDLLDVSRLEETMFNIGPSTGSAAESFSKGALDERIAHMDKTFQEYLLMLLDRRGLTDPEVYKRANIDRKHFSKIRSNRDYTPSKKTALALAIALELNLDETKDLLARAGLALSPSSIFDLIIEYCIKTGNYKVHDINTILFEYEQPTLGA